MLSRVLIARALQYLPQNMLSRAWGYTTRCERPRIAVSLLKRAFVLLNGLDMSEAAESIDSYKSLESLFVRRLRPRIRRIDADPHVVISPVDGSLGMFGTVTDGLCLQVKGRSYALADLLGDANQAKRFEGGFYMTLYLAPADYHRIHTPFSGHIHEAMLIPGGLLPVYPEALSHMDGVFVHNERVISYLDTATAGRIAVVKVGATLVGRIALAYDPTVRTNQQHAQKQHMRYDPPCALNKGSELGAFELGSTVVLLSEAHQISFDAMQVHMRFKMGQRIGQINVPCS